MSNGSKSIDQDKLTSALRQIKAIVEEALGQIEREERGSKKAARRAWAAGVNPTSVAFNMNVLAFMNRYARGLKGPQKFALLLAHLVKGNVSQQLPRAEVEKHWNKMKVVLGGRFNPAHANRAKAKGWVDSPKHGIYTLAGSWKECLARK